MTSCHIKVSDVNSGVVHAVSKLRIFWMLIVYFSHFAECFDSDRFQDKVQERKVGSIFSNKKLIGEGNAIKLFRHFMHKINVAISFLELSVFFFSFFLHNLKQKQIDIYVWKDWNQNLKCNGLADISQEVVKKITVKSHLVVIVVREVQHKSIYNIRVWYLSLHGSCCVDI